MLASFDESAELLHFGVSFDQESADGHARNPRLQRDVRKGSVHQPENARLRDWATSRLARHPEFRQIALYGGGVAPVHLP